MSSKTFNGLAKSGVAVVISAVLLYVISYGPVLAYCVYSKAGWNTFNVVVTVYRPLAFVVPEPFMRRYTRLCGLSDMETFYFVKATRSGARMQDYFDVDTEPPT